MKERIYVADTENTVPKENLIELEGACEGLDVKKNLLRESMKTFETETWAVGIAPVKLDPTEEDVRVVNSMPAFLNLIMSNKEYHDSTIYFHNLTYDAPQILAQLGYWDFKPRDKSLDKSEKQPNTYDVLANIQGSFYKMDVEFHDFKITFQDSLKLLPFSVDVIAKNLHTKAQKLTGSIDYSYQRYSGWPITDTEMKYIKNDVLVMSEALALLNNEGFDISKLTIGGICFSDFKKHFYEDAKNSSEMGPEAFEEYAKSQATKNRQTKYDYVLRSKFPELDADTDRWFRQAYRGGITRNMTQGAVVDCRDNRKTFYEKQKSNVIDFTGFTGPQVINHIDVNSLYPSVMHTSNRKDYLYPVGVPVFVENTDDSFFDLLDELMADKTKGFYIEVKIAGKVKPGKFAYLQKKYTQEEKENFDKSVMNLCGDQGLEIFGATEFITEIKNPTTFVFTEMDFKRVLECYELTYADYSKLAFFNLEAGLFDSYIDYWFDKKSQAKADGNKVMMMISKLMLNNLYGKLAQSPIKPTREIYVEDGVLMSTEVLSDGAGGYIPVGAYITSYARNVLIDGVHANWGNVLYMDTDSLFVIGDIKGVILDKYELGAWDLESVDLMGRYVRAKTYIQYASDSLEELKKGNLKIIIKAAGAPNSVKTRMLYNVSEKISGKWHFYKLDLDEQDNITNPKRPLDEVFNRFTTGLVEAGKLSKTNTKGGAILYPSTFSIL